MTGPDLAGYAVAATLAAVYPGGAVGAGVAAWSRRADLIDPSCDDLPGLFDRVLYRSLVAAMLVVGIAAIVVGWPALLAGVRVYDAFTMPRGNT